MKHDQYGLYIVGIVAIVGIVSLLLMVSGFDDITGQAYAFRQPTFPNTGGDEYQSVVTNYGEVEKEYALINQRNLNDEYETEMPTKQQGIYCYDEDGGNNLFYKGIVKKAGVTYEDVCVRNDVRIEEGESDDDLRGIREYYCTGEYTFGNLKSGKIVENTTLCRGDYMCQDGICVEY